MLCNCAEGLHFSAFHYVSIVMCCKVIVHYDRNLTGDG